MAFTQAQLQTSIDAGDPGCLITRFDAAGSSTDIYVQNCNINSSLKSGWTQVAQTQTSAQAYTAIKAALTK